MRVLLASCAVVMLVAGCGSQHAAVSALQRYEVLKPQLMMATTTSSRLGSDSIVLERELARGDVIKIHRCAVRLKLDALGLANHAGQAAGGVRVLIRTRQPTAVHAYFQLVLGGLERQWAEAVDLISLSDLVWLDPYLFSRRDAQRELQLDEDAQSNAWNAVQDTRQAVALRIRYRASFRYVPVQGAGRVALAPMSPQTRTSRRNGGEE